MPSVLHSMAAPLHFKTEPSPSPAGSLYKCHTTTQVRAGWARRIVHRTALPSNVLVMLASLHQPQHMLLPCFLACRYGPYRGAMFGSRKGVLVSMSDGRATTYAMFDLLQRGTFFIAPGEDVYGGMVVGEHNRDVDMDINPSKEKHLTNVRSVQADDKMVLPPPRQMTLEEAIG